ncbi:hypothetical protein L211DRAFT_761325, partial [Terfezia boudieri ATCC MYA-4762]
WTYENRRQAQQVLPWVWLGSMTATRDKELLSQRRITLLITVRSSMTAKAKLMDYPDYHSAVLEHCSQFPYQHSVCMLPVLQEALNPYPLDIPCPGSTLVFCETGNEKSAVVVASYIMHHYEASLVQACQVVQGRRFSVAFDDIHKYAL